MLFKGWCFAQALAPIWPLFGLVEFSNTVFAVFLSFFRLIEFAIEQAILGHAPLFKIVLFQLPFGIIIHVLLLIRPRAPNQGAA
ncbi:MAG: hypothetical protein ACFBZ9_05045 [Sphingomonadales bacterium]